jgi:dCMP deaminase
MSLKHRNFLNIAKEISMASKCVSKQVGAVIVKDGRILSSGYNGTPKGFINCCDHWNGEYTKDHHDWSLDYEIHAEMNAIVWAAREGIKIDGATLYCTLEPCFQCSKNMIQAGIKTIVYEKGYEYNDEERLNKFILDCNVEKIKI